MSGAAPQVETTISEAFARQVRSRPGERALAGIEWSPSFAELDGAANRVASSLLDRAGTGAGRVALLLRQDAPLLGAALGVLKAGKSVVVMNPSDPPARLARVHAAVEPEIVVTEPRHRELVAAAGVESRRCASLAELHGAGDANPPGIAVDPDALAFVVYTSGTTGAPKGVMHSHRTILHNARRQTDGLGIRATDRIALPASIGAGQGLAATWVALLNGATLCPFPITERGAAGLAEWLSELEVSVFVASASVFRTCAAVLGDARLPAVRLLRLGSEPVRWEDVELGRRHGAEGCVVANMYSSSEAGNITQRLIGPEVERPDGPLTAGHPAEGMEVRILDETGVEVPPGAPGEIAVRSAFLSPGYWRAEALTEERFAQAPGDDGARELRTGDLGRLSEDGSLIVDGRRDRALKVSGNRVEPAEIEAAIATHPDVGGAAVLPGKGARGATILTAFVALDGDRERSAPRLRSHLRRALPEHAVPAVFAFVDELPLTAGGSVDRERLASEQTSRGPEGSAEPARDETERLVADAWAEVLEVDAVGRHDEFYELGGDSLGAAIVAARLHAATGVELELAAFVEAPTVVEMATLVERLRESPSSSRTPPLVRVARDGPLPASVKQEFAWRRATQVAEPRFYTLAVAVAISGPLDAGALRLAIDHLVRRHEALRTTLAERDGALVQVVHPHAPVELPLSDLSASPDPAAEADAIRDAEAVSAFDLERHPLARFRLLRLSPREHRLLRVNHHAVSDAESWRLFFEELSELYDAYQRDLPPPLADELPLQYGDFAAWERRWLRTPGHEAELEWWRRSLAGAPRTDPLPFTRPAPDHGAAPADGEVALDLAPEVAGQLLRLARSERTTPFAVQQALLAAQLAAETGSGEVVLLSHVRNRRALAAQRMFGWFANAITLRLPVDRSATFRESLRVVRDGMAAAGARATIPIERLKRELADAGIEMPAPQAIVAEQHAPPVLRFSGLELATLPRPLEAMPLGFTLAVSPGDLGRASLRFDARVYDAALVRDFAVRIRRRATAAAADPDAAATSRSRLGLVGRLLRR